MTGNEKKTHVKKAKTLPIATPKKQRIKRDMHIVCITHMLIKINLVDFIEFILIKRCSACSRAMLNI